jgi:hypothetical protein
LTEYQIGHKKLLAVNRQWLFYERQAGAWNPITKNNLVQSTLADSDISPIVLLKDKSDVDDGGKDTFLSGRKNSTKLWEKWLTNLGKVVIIYLLF